MWFPPSRLGTLTWHWSRRLLVLWTVLHLWQPIDNLQIDDGSYEAKGQDASAALLKVLNLNTWGLFWPFARDHALRYEAIKDIIALGDYDIILLQEVWYRTDHEVLRKSAPFVTYFESFSPAGCSGYFLPLGCSGLSILSRHPIEAIEFRPFSFRGNFWKFDGEIFVGKGVGKARVRWKGLSVDVFTTHLVSYTSNPRVDNARIRYLQAVETVQYIQQSDADIKLFGGDLNSLPNMESNQPYGVLRTVMLDALTDKYPESSLHPWFATYGNVRNTYSAGSFPERIDYLMFWARPGLQMRTSDFMMPKFVTRNAENKIVSLSDHEPLHAEFLVESYYFNASNAESGGYPVVY